MLLSNRQIIFALGFALAGIVCREAFAEVIIDGLTACEKATNGRYYCKRRGSANYVPVSDEFFKRYLAALTAQIGDAPATQNSVDQLKNDVTITNQNVNQVNNAVNATNQNVNQLALMSAETATALNKRIGDLSAQIELLTKIVHEQEEKKKAASAPVVTIEQTIVAINTRINVLRQEYKQKNESFSAYLTSIKPNDRNEYLTARKYSEIYPRVPFYIPGTNEIGEFWIEPIVNDIGEQRFRFRFIDPASVNDKTRAQIDMSLSEIEETQKSLEKLHAWSILAHENKLRKIYEKRVTCFPISECPEDGKTIEGKASTEVRFQIYEDGSTSGRIQRNKGKFVEGYNFSIDSALLLQAYLSHVIDEAKQEFKSGTQSKDDLNKIFN